MPYLKTRLPASLAGMWNEKLERHSQSVVAYRVIYTGVRCPRGSLLHGASPPMVLRTIEAEVIGWVMARN